GLGGRERRGGSRVLYAPGATDDIAASSGGKTRHRTHVCGAGVHGSTETVPMYTTCMFCNKDLGRNERVESFPVGRRLAFDEARGRLWVVCRHCERWNLTPLEERWEAVEDCERIFRDTRLRAHTENVGLARTSEGLELVRIGRPLREEFAAWRYGDQFGRRRRRAILYGVGVGTAVAGLAIGGVALGVVSGAFVGQFGNFVNLWNNARTRARLKLPDGEVLKVKTPLLSKVQIFESDDKQGWAIQVRPEKKAGRFRSGEESLVLHGEEARRAASVLVPAVNAAGGNKDKVRDAVRALEEAGHPEDFLRSAPSLKPRRRAIQDVGPALALLPAPSRLALEMALHEEQEMRAMQGELWRLERAWEEAEEIASIADDLLLPESTDEQLEALRSRSE
ncbi:MAG: hypothetical protein RLN75_07900, partial [Longimicrobiales bacterium]